MNVNHIGWNPLHRCSFLSFAFSMTWGILGSVYCGRFICSSHVSVYWGFSCRPHLWQIIREYRWRLPFKSLTYSNGQQLIRANTLPWNRATRSIIFKWMMPRPNRTNLKPISPHTLALGRGRSLHYLFEETSALYRILSPAESYNISLPASIHDFGISDTNLQRIILVFIPGGFPALAPGNEYRT